MRFQGKYELLEQLTIGKVETFAALPVGGGERLLVHVFALPARIKVSPTNGDLLNYMQQVSPPALGSVIDAGRYDDGSQAYIVTKFPRDVEVLPKWVEAYKLLSRAHDTTAEVMTTELWESRSTEARPEPVAKKPAGDFTRAFQGVGSGRDMAEPESATDGSGEKPSGIRPASPLSGDDFAAGPPRQPAPDSFTGEFFAGLGEGLRLPQSGPSSEPAKRVEVARVSTAKPYVAPPDPWTKPSIPEAPEEQPKDASRAGEFTMFFRSPFAGQPSDPGPLVAEPLNQPLPGPAKGDFTMMFGTSSPAGGIAPTPAEPLLEPPSQEQGSFTRIFGKSAPAPDIPVTPVVNQAPPDPVLRPEVGTGYVVSQSTNLPPIPQPIAGTLPPVGPPPAYDNPLTYGQAEGATRVFKPSGSEVVPPPPPPPQGESEYTRIIRAGSAPPAAAEPGGSSPPAAPPAGSVPKISLPMPAMPPIPQVAVPPPPPPPAIQWTPPVPAVAMPKAPTAPPVPGGTKLGSAKKARAKTSYIPLIVILNLLLLAAVCLVLYFVFKH